MKFAHLGDCHLGGWRQPELKELNFKSFQTAIHRCIKEKVDFVLIAGDLFDSAYPSIETLKDTFQEFRKLKDSKIPVFLIAGSHDYSASGKTFLEVLEKAGFCKNVYSGEERNSSIVLEPTIHENIAIYGYPGKKSGLEVDEVERIKILGAPGMFKILMLHTTIRDAVRGIPVKSVDERYLPQVDYVALGHLHIDYNKNNIVYCGPLFPNSLSELAELKGGSFYIFDNGKIRKEIIRLKEVVYKHLEVSNALTATDNLISLFEKEDVSDKIVIIRLSGILEYGKLSDIDFRKVETLLKKKGAFVVLKSTSKVHLFEPETKIELTDSLNMESEIISMFEEKNPGKFSSLIDPLLKSLQMEKLEEEKSSNFEERLMSEIIKVIPNAS